jgi:uncharacterized protein
MMHTRRALITSAAMAGGACLTPSLSSSGDSPPLSSRADDVAQKIALMPHDDTHAHPIAELSVALDHHTTPKDFLLRISLAAFPLSKYFPEGVYEKWSGADPAQRSALEKTYRIEQLRDQLAVQFRDSVFVTYMVKEMAGFLRCKPTLEDVIGARNERGRDYYGYIHDLFADARVVNLMIDTGCCDDISARGLKEFAAAAAPAEVRPLARVDTIISEILKQDVSFDSLEASFLKTVQEALDGTGNLGMRSYGMKSWFLPVLGLMKPIYDPSVARRSYEEWRLKRNNLPSDRELAFLIGKEFRVYLLTLAMEECLRRDMPIQFHSGDGEAPYVILRNQNPYFLEEMVRFERDGVMRRPKVIAIHAGYPLVGEAAWLTHLYTNCFFEVSLMNPFINAGLSRRFLEALEVVPYSKFLFGSDSYHIPELFWLGAKWGKRYLGRALATYVDEGIATDEEALNMASMILSGNNRRLYGLGA